MPPGLQIPFPTGYRCARRAFIAASESRGVDVVSRVNPKAKGPDGAPLFLDAAALGPRDAKRALVLLSGIHGVDGIFGSGVQTGLMQAGIAPPPGARLVMVHAVNPFGFAWDRWANENNVDIDRNFIADFAHPPANPGYAELADAIALHDVSARGRAQADAALNAYAQRHGEDARQLAIYGGQYTHPDGLFFGGREPSWSAKALAAICTEDLVHARQVIAIALQTGPLGPGMRAGSARMIVDGDGPYFARAQAIWGKAAVPGRRPAGTLGAGLARMLGKSTLTPTLTFATLEAGTVPPDDRLWALRRAVAGAGGAGHLAQRPTPDPAQAAEITRAVRDAFFVDAPEWKKRAWTHALRLVTAALAALAAPAGGGE